MQLTSGVYAPEDVLRSVRSHKDLDQLLNKVVQRRGRSGSSDGLMLADAVLTRFKHPLVQRFGVDEVLRHMSASLQLMDEVLPGLLKDLVPQNLISQIGLHGDVATAVDPGRLMSFVVPGTSVTSDDWIDRGDLRSKHARMLLKFAIVGMAHRAADEPTWVSDDIRELMGVARHNSRMPSIRVVAQVTEGPELTVVAETLGVFDTDGQAEVYAAQIARDGVRTILIDRLCREVVVGDDTYYVYLDARRKRHMSLLLKSFRSFGRPDEQMKDNRGIADEIVAIRGRNGSLRLPERADAIRWSAELSERLIALDGVTLDDSVGAKKASHAGRMYWDTKVQGRIVRQRLLGLAGSVSTSGRLEWRIQPLLDSLLATLSATDEHHDLYASRRMWQDFLPIYAPHYEWGKPGSKEYVRAEMRWRELLLARLST